MLIERLSEGIYKYMILIKIKKYIKNKYKQDTVLMSIFAGIFRIFNKIKITPDYNAEITFWEGYLPNNMRELLNRENLEKVVPKYLVKYINDNIENNGDRLKILEVGSGPVSHLALIADKNMCDVIAVDPLAEYYQEIMNKINLSWPIKPIKGESEKLDCLFEKNYFDIIYTSNAIDHVVNPKKSLEKMVKVLKKGGIIMVEGYINEGSIECWRGLHKYDMFLQDRSLYCRKKNGRVFDMKNGLRLECIKDQVMKSRERGHGTVFMRNNNDDWYMIIYKKY